MSNEISAVSYRTRLKEQFERDYDAEAYVKRAVRAARASIAGPSPRWVAVGDTFACGSGYAHELCRRFGFDPDEQVRGARPLDGCQECGCYPCECERP